MSSYIEHLMEHARLSILRHLAAAPSYSANDSLLFDLLIQLGVSVTRDQVRSCIVWLAEQGMIENKEIATVMVPTITQRGIDVAAGRAIVPGVRRPSPGA